MYQLASTLGRVIVIPKVDFFSLLHQSSFLSYREVVVVHKADQVSLSPPHPPQVSIICCFIYSKSLRAISESLQTI